MTITNESKFSFNFNNTNQPESTRTSSTTSRTTTERQIQYYLDLCVQRRIPPKNYIIMNYDELAKEITELKNFYPASENQVKMINDKVALLSTLGCTINPPDFTKLTGGREGSASRLIEHLINLERQYNANQPPSESQLIFLVNMYLCPDIPFERFNITKRVELEGGLWRACTPDEFAQQITVKMKKTEASAFIDEHRGIFHTWKQTRVRPEQQRYIRELEARMSNTSSPSVLEWSVDQEGNLIQVKKKVDKAKEYSPNGYTPLDEMQLQMFSIEEASKYIDILKSELGRKELYKFGEVSDTSLTFESIRKPKTEDECNANQYKALQDLMFKLEAVAGYNDEELHDSVTSLLFEEGINDEKLKQQKLKIKEFMLQLVEEEYISFEGMIELCKESEIAQRIMLGM